VSACSSCEYVSVKLLCKCMYACGVYTTPIAVDLMCLYV
jgi:hypothetical protein